MLNYNYNFAPPGPKGENETYLEIGKFFREKYDSFVENINEKNFKDAIFDLSWMGATSVVIILLIIKEFSKKFKR